MNPISIFGKQKTQWPKSFSTYMLEPNTVHFDGNKFDLCCRPEIPTYLSSPDCIVDGHDRFWYKRLYGHIFMRGDIFAERQPKERNANYRGRISILLTSTFPECVFWLPRLPGTSQTADAFGLLASGNFSHAAGVLVCHCRNVKKANQSAMVVKNLCVRPISPFHNRRPHGQFLHIVFEILFIFVSTSMLKKMNERF